MVFLYTLVLLLDALLFITSLLAFDVSFRIIFSVGKYRCWDDGWILIGVR